MFLTIAISTFNVAHCGMPYGNFSPKYILGPGCVLKLHAYGSILPSFFIIVDVITYDRVALLLCGLHGTLESNLETRTCIKY